MTVHICHTRALRNMGRCHDIVTYACYDTFINKEGDSIMPDILPEALKRVEKITYHSDNWVSDMVKTGKKGGAFDLAAFLQKLRGENPGNPDLYR
jgi:hypothetical protein